MVLGAFAAIGQRNIKRLMAYSSIGHMGFALIGLAAGTAEGVQGVLIYMAIYLAMTLGTFAAILSMRRPEGQVEDIADLAGLARTNPGMAFFLAMLLFSLAGIPPLAGFFAKFYVFLAAIQAGLYMLAVIGVLASVVGAYYYLLIVKLMYFDEPAADFMPMPRELKAVLSVSGLFNLLFFVYPGAADRGSGGCGEVAVLADAVRPDRRRGRREAHRHETIGSTNTEACALARAGERGPLWITAARQTAGRGRRGNAWVSEPGNLYASLLLADVAPPDARGELSFVAALAVHDAVTALAPTLASRLAVKWPNDLLLGGAKFAGILIEARGQRAPSSASASIARIIPPKRPFPRPIWRRKAHDIPRSNCLSACRKRCCAGLQQWDRRRGLCRDPRRLARARHGRRPGIRVRLPARSLPARFQALDETGRLVLRLPTAACESILRARCSRGPITCYRRGKDHGGCKQELVFAPLGGVGEIGMNLSIYGLGSERRRTWLAIDCGMGFASEEHVPGVDRRSCPTSAIWWRSARTSPASSSRTAMKTTLARSSICGRA